MSQTVTERHIAFARAAVALAREHGMDNLSINFRSNFRNSESACNDPVNVTWHEGRHGDTNNIVVRHEAIDVIPELASKDPS